MRHLNVDHVIAVWLAHHTDLEVTRTGLQPHALIPITYNPLDPTGHMAKAKRQQYERGTELLAQGYTLITSPPVKLGTPEAGHARQSLGYHAPVYVRHNGDGTATFATLRPPDGDKTPPGQAAPCHHPGVTTR